MNNYLPKFTSDAIPNTVSINSWGGTSTNVGGNPWQGLDTNRIFKENLNEYKSQTKLDDSTLSRITMNPNGTLNLSSILDTNGVLKPTQLEQPVTTQPTTTQPTAVPQTPTLKDTLSQFKGIIQTADGQYLAYNDGLRGGTRLIDKSAAKLSGLPISTEGRSLSELQREYSVDTNTIYGPSTGGAIPKDATQLIKTPNGDWYAWNQNLSEGKFLFPVSAETATNSSLPKNLLNNTDKEITGLLGFQIMNPASADKDSLSQVSQDNLKTAQDYLKTNSPTQNTTPQTPSQTPAVVSGGTGGQEAPQGWSKLTAPISPITPSQTYQPDAEQLQKYLIQEGFLNEADVAGNWGIYGPKTISAVTNWQKANGVLPSNPADYGYWGPMSISKVQTLQPPQGPTMPVSAPQTPQTTQVSSAVNQTPQQPPTQTSLGQNEGKINGVYTYPTMSLSDQYGKNTYSKDTELLQRFLVQNGDTAANAFEGQWGYYGDKTKAAVAQLQRELGMTVPANEEGFFGPKTIAALQADKSRITNPANPAVQSGNALSISGTTAGMLPSLQGSTLTVSPNTPATNQLIGSATNLQGQSQDPTMVAFNQQMVNANKPLSENPNVLSTTQPSAQGYVQSTPGLQPTNQPTFSSGGTQTPPTTQLPQEGPQQSTQQPTQQQIQQQNQQQNNQVTQILSQYNLAGTPAANELAKKDPLKFVQDLSSAVYTNSKLPEIKSQYEIWVKKIEDLNNELNDKVADINDNPWYTEGVRQGKIVKMKEKYQGKIDSANNTAELLNKFYDSGLTEAQRTISNALTLYNNQVKFDQDVYLEKMKEAASNTELLLRLQNALDVKATPSGDTENNTSGTLIYTKSDIATGRQNLIATRGADGYADPSVYQAMYDLWIQKGGLQSTFLSKYPPKDYINPTNSWLPDYLMPPGSRKANAIPSGASLF